MKNLRTWIEIDASAARKNYDTFRKMIGPRVKLWAVVKSNAYGHGLLAFSKIAQEFGVDGFCVDSLVEGLALRRQGITKAILVLGPTLQARYEEAAANDITITISTFEALRGLAKLKNPPNFHIKIDTGMHRQGFYGEDITKVIKVLQSIDHGLGVRFTGTYTHFASAKDLNYPTYTDEQLKKFNAAIALFEGAGFSKLMKHAAATGGTLIDPKYHFDAVRIGIGLYGLWPSKELEVQMSQKITLHPVLSWRAVVSEVKNLKKGDYVGYDLYERVSRDMKMAVVPVGYWHGLPRSLSSTGEMLVNGKRVRILGRVAMDMTMVGFPPGLVAKEGDVATLIGRDKKDEIFAWEPSQKSGTTYYEYLTRLNPLMERIVVN